MVASSDNGIRRAKWLMQALIISGTLNIGLLSTFVYLTLRDRLTPLYVELKPPSAPSHAGLQQVALRYESLSFEELVEELASRQHVEAGYTKRDLALSILVAKRHFNLERALGGLPLQQRVVAFTDPKTLEKRELTIFPALADYQYEAILTYARTERWPLTPCGLFSALVKNPSEPSLLEAFSLTPEFYFIQTLFLKTGLTLGKNQIAALLKSGSWEIIEKMNRVLQTGGAFDVERRRELLIRLLAERSQLAAALLLQSDPVFILKRFDDPQMLAFLELLGTKTPALFAKALLLSPRSDALWKKAAHILYAQVGEMLPEPYDHRTSLSRFVQ